MKVIKARQKVGFLVLLMAWLMIVAIPVIAFRRVFNIFLETRLNQSIQRVRPQLYTELQHFVQDLEETPWLEKKLKDFAAHNKYLDRPVAQAKALNNDLGNESAEKIHQRLEKFLGFQVLSVFCHGVDTSKVDAYVKKLPDFAQREPPDAMIRRLFAIINGQASCQLIAPASYIAAFPGYASANDEKNKRIYSENFLQNYFATIMPVKVIPGEIVRTMASKTGKAGPIFLYYGLERWSSRDGMRNVRGFLLAVRLQDIPESAIVSDAVSRPFYPRFGRKTGFLKQPLPSPDSYADLNLSSFVMEKDSYSLYTVSPQRQIVRLAQRGTIFPENLSLFSAKTPGIKVSCPISEIEHPLANARLLVDLILGLLFLTGTMIFFRLYLFGFNLKLTVAVKIAAAVMFACFLPGSSLLLSTVAHDDYESNADKEKMLRQLQMRNSLMQTLINRKMGRYEKFTRSLAGEISALPGSSDDVYRKHLSDWGKKKPVACVIYKKMHDSLIEYLAEKPQSSLDLKMRRDANWVLLNSVEELVLSSPVVSEKPESVSAILSDSTKNGETSHFLLSNNGQLVAIPRVARDARISLLLVSETKAGKTSPTGIVIVDYDVFLLINDLIPELTKEIACHEEEGNEKIDVAIGQVKHGRVELIDDLTSGAINRDTAIRQMESCYRLKKEIRWADRTEDNEVQALAHFDQNLPLVVLTQISRPISAEVAKFWWLPVLYVLLVILLVLLITRAIFIHPAQQLVNGLDEIAGGNLHYQMVLATGDEFEVIGNECNNMTASLLEKARLEQYVSAEVLAEVRKSTEAELQPGGERIDATVMFVSLRIRDGVENVRLELLNLFLGIAEPICTQNGGMVDKIIGHTLMMVFRSNGLGINHQKQACTAVCQIKLAFAESVAGDKYVLSAGISSGSLVSGKIGSHNGKLDYTVIGDVVNLAARLKSHSELLGDGAIICSESMAGLQSEFFVIQPESQIQIKGKADRCNTYRLIPG